MTARFFEIGDTIEYVGGDVTWLYNPVSTINLIDDLTVAYVTLQSSGLTVGQQATWAVTASGGMLPYTFQYRLYRQDLTDTGTTFYFVSGSSLTTDSNVYSFTIPSEGRYVLQFQIADASGDLLVFQSAKYETPTNALATKVAEVVAECAPDGLRDDQKALNLHNWLCENASYDNTLTIHDPSGVLLNGSGVCESFALAYQMLLTEAGIENIYVVGTANGGPHAWNMVRLDGEWYHVDVTWDEASTEAYYFGMSTALISRDHTAETRVPTTTATTYNYALNHSDGAFSSLDELGALLDALPAGQTSFKFYYLGSNNIGSAYGEWAQANASVYGLTSYGSSGGSYTRFVRGTRIAQGPSLSSVTASAGSATVGESVTWTAVATGDALQYNFVLVQNDVDLQDAGWTDSNTFTYTFTEPGTYCVRVCVRNGSGSLSETITSEAVTVEPIPDHSPVLSSVTADASQIAPGESVTWTASASGGEGALSYSFALYKDDALYRSFSWTDAGAITVALTESGAYRMQARARDASGARSDFVWSETTEVTGAPELTLHSVKAATQSIKTGETAVWTANADGGTGNLEYNYTLLRDNVTWKSFGWSADSTFSIRITEAGSYALTVRVRDESGALTDAVRSDPVRATASSALILYGVNASATDVNVGDTVTWTADYFGGVGAVEFHCMLLMDNAELKELGKRSTGSYAWTFDAPGDYRLMMYLMDGKTRSECVWSETVHVSAGSEVCLTSLSADRTESKPGGSITWTVTAVGGTGALEYCYTLWKDGEIYNQFDWTGQSCLTVSLTEAGSYRMQVVARDACEHVSSEQWAEEVRVVSEKPPVLTATETTVTEAQPGESVTWTVRATGGTGSLTYRYAIWRDDVQAATYAWTSSNTLSYTFTEPGVYRLQVLAADADGKQSEYLWSPEITVSDPSTVVIHSVSANVSSANQDQSVSWTICASGGSGSLQYSCALYKYGAHYASFSGNSSSVSYTFTEPGVYRLQVHATDAKGAQSEYAWSDAVTITEVVVEEPRSAHNDDETGVIIADHLDSSSEATALEIMDDLPAVKIDPDAFEGVATLASIDLPNIVQIIGIYAFSICIALSTIF